MSRNTDNELHYMMKLNHYTKMHKLNNKNRKIKYKMSKYERKLMHSQYGGMFYETNETKETNKKLIENLELQIAKIKSQIDPMSSKNILDTVSETTLSQLKKTLLSMQTELAKKNEEILIEILIKKKLDNWFSEFVPVIPITNPITYTKTKTIVSELNEDQKRIMFDNLPHRMRDYEPYLIHNIEEHGNSFSNIMTKISNMDNILIFIKDAHAVFGVYYNSLHNYDSFIFTTYLQEKNNLKVYKPFNIDVNCSTNIIYTKNPLSLQFGISSTQCKDNCGAALTLNHPNLEFGFSQKSECYKSDSPLTQVNADTNQFFIQSFEVWHFE